jgi:hypothetical protein
MPFMACYRYQASFFLNVRNCMARWRAAASERLPELREVTASSQSRRSIWRLCGSNQMLRLLGMTEEIAFTTFA